MIANWTFPLQNRQSKPLQYKREKNVVIDSKKKNIITVASSTFILNLKKKKINFVKNSPAYKIRILFQNKSHAFSIKKHKIVRLKQTNIFVLYSGFDVIKYYKQKKILKIKFWEMIQRVSLVTLVKYRNLHVTISVV